MKKMLNEQKEADAQLRLMQLNLAESRIHTQNKILQPTQISTIKDLNTLEEEADDLV